MENRKELINADWCNMPEYMDRIIGQGCDNGLYWIAIAPIDEWEPVFHDYNCAQEYVPANAVRAGMEISNRTVLDMMRSISDSDAGDIYRAVLQTVFVPDFSEASGMLKPFQFIIAKSYSNGTSYIAANDIYVLNAMFRIGFALGNGANYSII